MLSSVPRNVVNVSSFSSFAGKRDYLRELGPSLAFWELMALLCCLSPLPSGYSPTIKGQLLHVDTTSSMQYRTLLEAEMLAVSSRQLYETHFSLLCGQKFEKNHFSIDLRCKRKLMKCKVRSACSVVSVSCHSQLPPCMEHASVVAVWDWGVQGHLPLHLRPEKLLHWWVLQWTDAITVQIVSI